MGWQVLRGWGDDQAEVEEAVGVLAKSPRFDPKSEPPRGVQVNSGSESQVSHADSASADQAAACFATS